MAIQNRNKLNQLEHSLPEGLLVDAAWLEQHGYSRSLRSQYVSGGWLKRPTRGVFRRPRGELSWEQVVVSLQTLLKTPVSIGGKTALELQGYAHYLPQNLKSVHLYSDVKLPSWLYKLSLKQKFVVHNRLRFLPEVNIGTDNLSLNTPTKAESKIILDGALRMISWGQWDWPLLISTPERAFLELLDELPNNETFHLIDVTMEGLTNLSPRRMQALLESTSSIKVKRLFFFFADRHQHSWFKHISRDKIDLGVGKRMLVKGGKFNSEYQITVPKELSEVEKIGF